MEKEGGNWARGGKEESTMNEQRLFHARRIYSDDTNKGIIAEMGKDTTHTIANVETWIRRCLILHLAEKEFKRNRE